MVLQYWRNVSQDMKISDKQLSQSLGIRIRELREASGESVVTLCKKVGITRGYWYAVEAANENPTVETLSKIASVLGVSVRDLLEPVKKRRTA